MKKIHYSFEYTTNVVLLKTLQEKFNGTKPQSSKKEYKAYLFLLMIMSLELCFKHIKFLGDNINNNVR